MQTAGEVKGRESEVLGVGRGGGGGWGLQGIINIASFCLAVSESAD